MSNFSEFIQKKKTILIIAIVAIIVIIGLAVGIPCGIFFTPKKGALSTYAYDSSKPFNIATDGYVLTKSDDKDFKIMNIADLQMSAMYSASQNKQNYALVKEMVEVEKPDLITFTGDNFWLYNAKEATKRFIKNIDSLGVPWAPAFGNHEPESEVDKNWIIEQFLTAENCIFNYGENSNRAADLAKGPNNIAGVGNYVINIKNTAGKIINTIIMMDSHSNNGNQHPEYFNNPSVGVKVDELDGWFTNGGYLYRPYTKEELAKDNTLTGSKAVGTNYDFIKQSQIDWYEWVIKGIQEANDGEIVKSELFFHIPLPEFNIAAAIYEKQLIEKYGSIKDENGKYTIDGKESVNGNFGLNREGICSPYYNSGLFDKITELKSTKDVIVGHDHVNNTSIVYKDVRLTYGLKTGNGCYWDESGEVSGCTMIAINGEGVTSTEHKYYPFEK